MPLVPASSRFLLAAAALLALAGAARAGVIVVSPTGGGDFTTFPPALLAAAEGDTIVVEPASCTLCWDEYITIDGKSLTIVFDSPTAPQSAFHVEAITVRNLAADQTVVLRGLRSQPIFGGNAPAVTLTNNAGAVWVEDCELTGGKGDGFAGFGCSFATDLPGGPAVRAVDCAAVTIVDSKLTGGLGTAAFFDPTHAWWAGQATDGGNALEAVDSSVAVYESALSGGPGGAGHICEELADGGFGLEASGSMVLLSGCTVSGGVAGAGPPAGAPGGGVRGDASSFFDILDVTFVPAPGGVELDTAPGTVTTYPAPSRVFELPSPLREGQAGTLHVEGVQGDFVGFFWAFDSVILPMPARNGWFLIAAPFVAGPFLVGAITDPSGTWDVPITGPNLPPAAGAQTFLLQAYFAHPGGATLGSGTAFTLLDATF